MHVYYLVFTIYCIYNIYTIYYILYNCIHTVYFVVPSREWLHLDRKPYMAVKQGCSGGEEEEEETVETDFRLETHF